MENAFQLPGSVTQRSSEAMTMAPTASMIDPNLENRSMSASRMSHSYNTSQIQRGPTVLRDQSSLPQGIETSPGRTLPSVKIDDASIDDSYVQFIMYCNPSIPSTTDTNELRKSFRSPPKSDGKTFSPFVLFGLISKLEAKEIKTWTQLVIALGVEPPDASKHQSTQKVQQYAVRLKRWLHASHVDAFFHYCMGVPNSYYTDRPSAHDGMPETARDGVFPEDDHALRALLPEWRPKRGRRKAEDNESEGTPNKKTQFRRSASSDFFTNFDEQYSAQPPSAVPWSAQPQPVDAWGATPVTIAPKVQNSSQAPLSGHLSAQSAGHQIRWRLNERENAPSTPYPQSAITPRQSYSASASFEEPRSANPASDAGKSPSRGRKRHGSAVSSAWPASASSATGKLRGRPPSNRSIQDGPFSTFPANPSPSPNPKEAPTINISTPIQASGQLLSQDSASNPQPTLQPIATEQSLLRKPSKLQLQVPEHSGGPVRLATPPCVVINGESNRPVSTSRRSSAEFFNQIDEGSEEGGEDEDDNVDWKRRAMTLKRRLKEKEEELRAVKRKVLDAVM